MGQRRSSRAAWLEDVLGGAAVTEAGARVFEAEEAGVAAGAPNEHMSREPQDEVGRDAKHQGVAMASPDREKLERVSG